MKVSSQISPLHARKKKTNNTPRARWQRSQITVRGASYVRCRCQRRQRKRCTAPTIFLSPPPRAHNKHALPAVKDVASANHHSAHVEIPHETFTKPVPKAPTETMHGAAVPNYAKSQSEASHSVHVEIPHEVFHKAAAKAPTETVHGSAVPNYMKPKSEANHSAHVEIPHDVFHKPAAKPATVPVHDVPSYMLPRPGH